MTVDEEHAANPAEKAGLAKADAQIESRDRKGALDTLKLADAQLEARKAALGVRDTPDEIEAMRNKGERRTPDKRELLRFTAECARLAGCTSPMTYR